METIYTDPRVHQSKGNLWSFIVDVEMGTCLKKKNLLSLYLFFYYLQIKTEFQTPNITSICSSGYELQFHMETAEECILFLEVADRAIDHPLSQEIFSQQYL